MRNKFTKTPPANARGVCEPHVNNGERVRAYSVPSAYTIEPLTMVSTDVISLSFESGTVK